MPPRHAAPTLAEHSRRDREPNPAEQKGMVPQSGAYQNWSRIWNLIYPNLPAGTTPPLVYFGRKWLGDIPVGAGATTDSLDGAGYRGGQYTGRTVGLPEQAAAFDQLATHPRLIDALIHETAHTAQTPGVYHNPPVAEGGADALAILLRNQVQRMFGAPNPGPYKGYAHQTNFDYWTNPGATAPNTQGDWFLQTYGPQYATHGQFTDTTPPLLPQSPAAELLGARRAPPAQLAALLAALRPALPQPAHF